MPKSKNILRLLLSFVRTTYYRPPILKRRTSHGRLSSFNTLTGIPHDFWFNIRVDSKVHHIDRAQFSKQRCAKVRSQKITEYPSTTLLQSHPRDCSSSSERTIIYLKNRESYATRRFFVKFDIDIQPVLYHARNGDTRLSLPTPSGPIRLKLLKHTAAYISNQQTNHFIERNRKPTYTQTLLKKMRRAALIVA